MDTSILPAQSSPLLALPPQPRLDLLPSELLQEIIGYLAPIPLHHRQYQSRQSTLRSLCLTSKHLLTFAQPALFTALVLSEKQVARVLRRSDLLVHCRCIRVAFNTSEPKLETDLNTIFKTATRFDDLSCYGNMRRSTWYGVSSKSSRASRLHSGLTEFLFYADVTKLHLYAVFLTQPFSSPHLKELSLYSMASVPSETLQIGGLFPYPLCDISPPTV